MSDHEREVIAQLSRIEEQNRQIIALLQGKYTAFGGYVDQQPHYGQLEQGQWQVLPPEGGYLK